MTQSRVEKGDAIRSKYEELCRELNMDRETEERSWQKYLEMSQSCSLEGNPLHWVCCALYASCVDSYTPTVGGTNDVVLGNCISVRNLLRSCNMGIYDFTTKMKQWHQMAKLSDSFLDQINKMERSYSITSNVFVKYGEIFEKIFVPPPNEKKNCKFRSAKCPYSKLFEICWCLYLCAKNQNQLNGIVMSLHLLILCIDLMYRNVLRDNPDLINPNFEGAPPKWGRADFDAQTIKDYSIVDALCSMTNASPQDAKNIKDIFVGIIDDFFKANTLKGQEDSLISNANFERNLQSLRNSYEHYVLNMAELDERIFLDYRNINNSNTSSGMKIEVHPDMKSLMPNTPYTRKDSLPLKEGVYDPVANATNNVKKLHELPSRNGPSEFIRQAIDDEDLRRIEDKFALMSKQFLSLFPNKEEAVSKFHLAKSWYYFLLDKILQFEVGIKKIDLKSFFQMDSFVTTLMACSMEIVLYAYDSPLKFPWILKCFSINALDFYKPIELMVRSHDGFLTRELIKHLNLIEETCLESLAWLQTSPLWDLITKEPKPLPTWSEVKAENSDNTGPPLPIARRQASDNHRVGNDSVRRDLFNTPEETTSQVNSNRVSDTCSNGPKRSRPLKLFLRKFYNLAWMRIKELCKDMELAEPMLQKIWTLFEYSITQKTELMKDRHLDQIIMCAIYLYIRVDKVKDKFFRDIMKSYRKQPQATSGIYREVLMEAEGEDKKVGDIILFYNEIYMQEMTPYALNFGGGQDGTDHSLLLSPHPTERQPSTRRASNTHHFYVSCMEKNEVEKLTASPNYLTYEFCRSPSKDLEKINAITSKGKRPFTYTLNDSSTVDKKRHRTLPGNRKLLQVFEDRKEKRK